MDLILKTLVDSYFLCIVECFYLGLLFETLEHKNSFATHSVYWGKQVCPGAKLER